MKPISKEFFNAKKLLLSSQKYGFADPRSQIRYPEKPIPDPGVKEASSGFPTLPITLIYFALTAPDLCTVGRYGMPMPKPIMVVSKTVYYSIIYLHLFF